MGGGHSVHQKTRGSPQQAHLRDHELSDAMPVRIRERKFSGRISADVSANDFPCLRGLSPVSLANPVRGDGAAFAFAKAAWRRVLNVEHASKPLRPLNDRKRRVGDLTRTFPAPTVFRGGTVFRVMQEVTRRECDAVDCVASWRLFAFLGGFL